MSVIRVSARGVVVEVEWDELGEPAPAVRTAVAEPEPVAEQPIDQDDKFPLCANTVGVFYRAPEPGAEPFVTEGDVIKPGQQVAIVEAMKLMIPVEAEHAGRIIEILVGDGTAVEHGQPLMILEPAA